jgi:hypothetical protein
MTKEIDKSGRTVVKRTIAAELAASAPTSNVGIGRCDFLAAGSVYASPGSTGPGIWLNRLEAALPHVLGCIVFVDPCAIAVNTAAVTAPNKRISGCYFSPARNVTTEPVGTVSSWVGHRRLKSCSSHELNDFFGIKFLTLAIDTPGTVLYV